MSIIVFLIKVPVYLLFLIHTLLKFNENSKTLEKFLNLLHDHITVFVVLYWPVSPVSSDNIN